MTAQPEISNRGTTTIPARVVAQIAAQAALEVGHVGSSAGGVLGVGARRNFHSRPDVECDLYGQVAVLRMDIGVVFPIPLHSILTQLRDHVRAEVERCTDLEVRRIDVAISWLDPSTKVRGALR